MKQGHESLSALGHRFLICDPERGEVFYSAAAVAAHGRRKSGKSLGSRAGDGYFQVCLGGRRYLRSRVIWSMCNGDIAPGLQVDHINGLRHDDRLANLRLVSCRENSLNRSECPNRSAYGAGILWHGKCGLFRIRVSLNGERWEMTAYSLEEARAKLGWMREVAGGYTPDHGLRPAYVPPKASD